MNKYIIHLSDIHYRENWEEEQGVVLNEFFSDLSKQIEKLDSPNIYLALSGDICQTGDNIDLYQSFYNYFSKNLDRIGITKNKRICVPGNHDASRNIVEKKYIEHEGVIGQCLNEKDFNDYLHGDPVIFKSKFENYSLFEDSFAHYTATDNMFSGSSWEIDNDLSIFLLNSAIFACGGHRGIDDKGRLSVDTRSLNKWLHECKCQVKVLIMHHPLSWLTQWSEKELRQILHKECSLFLYGHKHDQSVYHMVKEDFSLVKCSAPPLFTSKKDELGYSIISISPCGVDNIMYRQWTKNRKFVTGVNFSNSDDGIVHIKNKSCNGNFEYHTLLTKQFEERLNVALKSYSLQPLIWVEPTIGRKSGLSGEQLKDKSNKVDVDDIISNPKSAIFKAPPQFGLTCLGLYIASEAWKRNSFFWLYIDFKEIKSIIKIEKYIASHLKFIGNDKQVIHGIILDSWVRGESNSVKILEKLMSLYANVPLLIMQTIEDSTFSFEVDMEISGCDFDKYYLLALPRENIRKVVSAYNDEREIGEEDSVVSKVTNDLDVLNIHRTPFNCLTLLKVSEKYFDESPVNRTKMLEMVLFLLFDVESIPTYKIKPDLKDCEFILGRFCEKIIRGCNNSFSREEFLGELELYCRERLIALEIEVVFDVLLANQIITKRDISYSFRFTYWIYYFAAQRMHHDKEFAEYILHEQHYASFPEIIEFYTGIDRRRDDALKILTDDLDKISLAVHDKVGIPDGMNPLGLLKYNATEENLQKMKDDISESVSRSNLPDEVKDRHADRNWDQSKPYTQSISNILHEYSLWLMMKTTIACCRALRNSDYVDPYIKKKMLSSILKSWEQLSKVFFAITPLLSLKGSAIFEGLNIVLCGDFGDELEERTIQILTNIPYNVVNIFHDDIFSEKMGPLVYSHIDKIDNDLIKYELMLLLIYKRPRKWREHVEKYIISLPIDSFFLNDLINKLLGQLNYSFSSLEENRDMRFLIKLGAAKHEYNVKQPNINKIRNITIPAKEAADQTK